MKETARNSYRGGGTDTEFVAMFVEEVGHESGRLLIGASGIFIQCCDEYTCNNHTSAVMLPETFDRRHEELREHARRFAMSAGVPLLVVKHKPQDYRFEGRIDARVALGRQPFERVGEEWGSVALYLAQLQDDHTERRHPELEECHIEHTGGGRADPDEDSTLSDFIRCVKGVRHIDIDLSLHCQACAAPVAAFEFSTDPRKRIHMLTRASRTPVFRVIHERNAVPFRRSASDVQWSKHVGNPFRARAEGDDWESLMEAIVSMKHRGCSLARV